jgi:hypothetical protein
MSGNVAVSRQAIRSFDEPDSSIKQLFFVGKIGVNRGEKHLALGRIILNCMPDSMRGPVIHVLPTAHEKQEHKKKVSVQRIPRPHRKSGLLGVLPNGFSVIRRQSARDCTAAPDDTKAARLGHLCRSFTQYARLGDRRA